MLFGIVVYGIGSFLCFIANSIEVLLVSRFIQAFGASAGSVVTQTILRESVEGHRGMLCLLKSRQSLLLHQR